MTLYEWLSIIGAFTGVAAVGRHVWRDLADRPKVKVRARYDTTVPEYVSGGILYVTAVNSGQRRAVAQSLAFIFKSKRGRLLVDLSADVGYDAQLSGTPPWSIEPDGGSIQLWVYVEEARLRGIQSLRLGDLEGEIAHELWETPPTSVCVVSTAGKHWCCDIPLEMHKAWPTASGT